MSQFLILSRNSPHFMEPKCSSPYSQQLTTSLYPEPHESSPRHPIPFLYDSFWCYPTNYASSSLWSLCFRFFHQNPVCISLIPCACHVPRPTHAPWSDHANNIWYTWKIHQTIRVAVSVTRIQLLGCIEYSALNTRRFTFVLKVNCEELSCDN
jgi:hypothetical protein